MKTFSQMGVTDELVKGLEEKGIVEPTEIQEKAIPHLLGAGGDFVGQAQTGTGKTAAFGAPLLQKIDPSQDKVQGLVLAPTRELAKQIAKQLFHYCKYAGKIYIETTAGGDKIEQQVKALQRPTHIVVATPGRLLDLLKLKAVDLSALRALVLDEADEMLSMGFREELEAILEQTRGKRPVWLFSATMPPGIRRLVEAFLSPEAKRVQVDRLHVVNRNIDHQYAICRIEEKPEQILRFLKAQGGRRGIVFCRSRLGTIKLGEELLAGGYAVGVLQGELSQKERDKVMRGFKKGRSQVLVCTDVAARGIDVEELAFVVHHQLPDQTEIYAHRSGRTARAGRKGLSIAFITSGDQARLHEIAKELNVTFKQIRTE